MSEQELKDAVIEQIKTCYDPEIPVNIYDLGLIYEVNLHDNKTVEVIMTLTSPACPAAGTLPAEVEQKAAMTEGIETAVVQVTFDPAWDKSMMSEEAKFELGFI